MSSLAAKIEANQQKRQALEAELEQDKTALQLLLAHPRGELPETVPSSAVVTAAAASALQAADEEKRRRDEADAIRRQSDSDAADGARRERMLKLRQQLEVLLLLEAGFNFRGQRIHPLVSEAVREG